MTRYLKLVRHEDGKWKALPTETDVLAQVSLRERHYAPIDPDQLLKALDSLLSINGGIKSVEDVPRLASLMKKFSKKLVSRCVYCNVLMATEPDILSEYLDKGGWDTINTWLDFAKSSTSASFLIEMLKLCKLLPMTVDRLKENNTAKLIKSLTKHENDDVKSLSSELVSSWMTIIKGKKPDPPPGDKKKKKIKQKSEVKKDSESEVENSDVKPATEVPKSPQKIKGTKRPSSEKEIKDSYNEDVKIEFGSLMPVSKKPRPDRPKTAKVYHKKFRSTGLEEESLLPKKIPKKTPIVDKTAALNAAKSVLKLNNPIHDRITEKKLKPENLAAINETSSTTKGIKLIPAKPRPTYMLHESASFMDALTSLPASAPVKRKKKSPTNKPSSSPMSPTITAPKLQFYKDTLEMSDENAEKEEKENSDGIKKESSPEEEAEIKLEIKIENKEEPMEVCDEGGWTPPNIDAEKSTSPITNGDSQDMEDDKSIIFKTDPDELRSILSHGRRKGRKKSVKWVEDENIRQIFYFELDETERVNVLKAQNFGDLKSIELKREREAIEQAKRQAGDRMEEMTRWWIVPILMDLPDPLVERGCQSKEKETEILRQQMTLQEIYFTKEMIPDSPHEPDLEIVPAQEPKIIPLDEDNVIGLLTDHTKPKPAPLPVVLSSLIKTNTQLPVSVTSPIHNQDQIHIENAPIKQPLLSSEGLIPQTSPLQMASPYDPGEPVANNMPSNSLLGPSPPPVQNMYVMSSPPMTDNHNVGPKSEWRTLDMVQDQYYDNYPPNSGGNRNMPPPNQAPNMNMRPRMMNDNYRPMHKGPPRGMGPRPRNIHRVPCRHFMAGSCRFGMKCSFLHPGVNGPPL